MPEVWVRASSTCVLYVCCSCEQLLVNMVPLSVRTSIFCRLVLCRAPSCDLRFHAVAGGYRTCSCIVRVRQSYSYILCTHVTKPLSYTLPDRSRPRQCRSSAAIRVQQVHNTMDACTPPAHSERLARDRAGAGRPLHMRRRTLRALRPRPRHLQPARRPLRADSHRCPQQLRTAFGAAGASLCAAADAAAAEMLGTAAAMLRAEDWIPVRVERGYSIAARAAAA